MQALWCYRVSINTMYRCTYTDASCCIEAWVKLSSGIMAISHDNFALHVARTRALTDNFALHVARTRALHHAPLRCNSNIQSYMTGSWSWRFRDSARPLLAWIHYITADFFSIIPGSVLIVWRIVTLDSPWNRCNCAEGKPRSIDLFLGVRIKKLWIRVGMTAATYCIFFARNILIASYEGVI